MPNKSKYQRLKEEGKCPDCEQKTGSLEFIYCRECRQKRADVEYSHKNGSWKKKTSFKCVDCKKEFPVTDPRQGTICKSCQGIRGLNQRYLTKYKKTYDQIISIYESQNKKCAICSKVLDKPGEGSKFFRTNQACVDHNHKTGKVRGILCGRCNTKLGTFSEDELRIIAKYI